MTDNIRQLHAKADAMLSLLAARALEDLAGAVLPGQSYEARVTGSSVVPVDPDDRDAGSVALTSTERAADRLAQAATYRQVERTLAKVVDLLVKCHEDVTPTGAQCRSTARDPHNGQLVQCERMATRRGHCDKCASHRRQSVPPDAELLREWNARLERDCACESAACTHVPGRCTNRIKPGDRARSCGSCRNRRSQFQEAS